MSFFYLLPVLLFGAVVAFRYFGGWAALAAFLPLESRICWKSV